ncbi:MAG: thiamine diphosphokinase [Anaerolineae bacterium]|nr:thiamine diphosphokinase [Anaerolineae bacterium]
MSRIVIFANGILNRPELTRIRLRSTDRIFCANGGTRHALDLGLTPEAIIGDLDSVSPEVVAEMQIGRVKIHHHPARKDQTDLELALQLAITQEPDEILLLTALGGRLDQMLANILLLTRPEFASVRLALADGPYWATLLRSNQSITIRGRSGDTLSLIPLTPTVNQVSLTGVEWPLADAVLSLGSTLTISNTLAAEQADLRVGEGLVLVVHFEQDSR